MKAKVPSVVQVVELDSAKYELRCLKCVRSITVADPHGNHAKGFYIRHTHAERKLDA